MIKINYGKGSENLKEDEKDLVVSLFEEYFDKLEKHFKKIDLFEVHLKCHKKEGNVTRYLVETSIDFNNRKFNAEVEDYKLSEAVHKNIKKLQNEIEHQLHLSDQKRK
ncbi:MAG: hypothetical protein WC979_05485 [Candidatus Pacearchaeota archaeon]|jgi:ribosome-associated translation inhibitor RaiA